VSGTESRKDSHLLGIHSATEFLSHLESLAASHHHVDVMNRSTQELIAHATANQVDRRLSHRDCHRSKGPENILNLSVKSTVEIDFVHLDIASNA
jgi:hypothetical protein